MSPRPAALVLALAAAGLLPALARAETRVSFLAPQTYTDGNLGWGPVDQRLTLEGLERIIGKLAEKRLASGDDLDVAVLDIDLAGQINPVRAPSGTLRVMRADTWPSMRLRYTLRRGGRTLARGEETIRSIDYLSDPSTVRSLDPLRFEKAMLADWFRARFGGATPGRLPPAS
ncbi:DUF3016 domain-containing protein [Ancylobacter mangrovi]|uniref:DUF3016 domain-containing protein n=1 Tax=Ancylobacter mangrovi TaxID=2972472 RepID=UPI0021612B7E|nr:DUF3016 domain-containing protein [Ancylobacter mangrovi]MCS0502977.1 DUF3016 domain-containing protein [Ancylobacter mangrovi]